MSVVALSGKLQLDVRGFKSYKSVVCTNEQLLEGFVSADTSTGSDAHSAPVAYDDSMFPSGLLGRERLLKSQVCLLVRAAGGSVCSFKQRKDGSM